MNVAVARLIGYAPMLTPGKVRELRHLDWVADNSALTAAIGWQPVFTLEQGLRRTMGWGDRDRQR
jgi:nucleoside-diphosphate-sugar epimerase